MPLQPSTTPLSVTFRRLIGRRLVRRLLLVTTVVTSVLAVVAQLHAAAAARQRWGETRPVVVARRDLAAGDLIDAAAVDVRRLPVAAVPADVLPDPPLGSVVRYPIVAGEAVLSKRIAPEGLRGVAARVPDGERAVAVPATRDGRPPLQVGDRVDVVAVVATPGEPDGSVPAAPLVGDALVVDLGDEAVSVAVPSDEAPTLAYAVTQGTVVLALAGAR
jgi:Flp pilus assembly protein CpaB